jgi:hypothetical protein
MWHAYGNANIHANRDCDGNCYIHCDCDGNSHIHSDGYRDRYCHVNSNCHSDSNGYRYSNCDCTAAAFTNATASANTAGACGEQLLR